MIRWPFVKPNLRSAGFFPANGTPVTGKHFNRLFSEVIALEGAIGKNPEGSAVDLKTRLTNAGMNDDGTFSKELICEDDPSNNKRGCRRYVDTQWVEHATGTGQASGTVTKLGYTLYPEPPTIIAQQLMSDADDFIKGVSSFYCRALSEIAANLQSRGINGSAPTASKTFRIAYIAISRNLQIFEENVAWAIQPIRTGS